ncbi:MAG: hypothetical protein PHF60_05515 [Candidatus ainarchaeum sp.]|nr:hypothetical protein [Candidatus ainarchaeum sp.]
MVSGRRPFLAEIDVCTDRRIVRNISLTCIGMTRREAKKTVIEDFKKLRASGGYAVLQPMTGTSENGSAVYGLDRKVPPRVLKRHEGFHRSAAKFRKGPDSWQVEESAAYAYESTLKPWNAWEEHHIAKYMEKYSNLARHSVRLLVALDLAEPNGLLKSSIAELKRHSSAIAGDTRAIAFNNAKDYVLYLECLEIVRKWRRKDAKKIFLEAMDVASENGFHEARTFLLRQLPKDRVEAIQDSYGIDLRGFRFTSLYAPDVVVDNWTWKT